jgi:hypothetical protein
MVRRIWVESVDSFWCGSSVAGSNAVAMANGRSWLLAVGTDVDAAVAAGALPPLEAAVAGVGVRAAGAVD